MVGIAHRAVRPVAATTGPGRDDTASIGQIIGTLPARVSTGHPACAVPRHTSITIATQVYLAGVEETDRAIIAALVDDGRLSYTDLAERVGLSVSAVHQRVRRLEQRGVIKGYSARVNFDAVGLPLAAFVAIRPLDHSQPDDAPERLATLAEIEACYSVAGEDFYLLMVRVESPAGLERLLQQIRKIANVTTRTTVVLSTPYEARAPRVR